MVDFRREDEVVFREPSDRMPSPPGRRGIDGSRVVWARELNRDSNENLMRYFGDRRAWLVEPDAVYARAVPYRDAPYRAMPFVQVGAPGIETLRSAENVQRGVLAKANLGAGTLLSCDAWNYYFTEQTGVAGPDVTKGCYPVSNRGQLVDFEHWFSWLLLQR